MSWQEKDRMKLRKEFVLQAKKESTNIADLCRRYGVSRKTGYKWLNRYSEGGEDLLCDQSRRPHQSNKKVLPVVVEKIINIREKHPCWGARKIRAVLQRTETSLPAVSTVHKLLKQRGYVAQEKSAPHAWKRFEHEAPNRLWQMDFKGHFAYEKGRCHPLTVLDDHSRFSVVLQACTDEKGDTIKPILINTFRRYGLPERINVDNGNPWGSLFEHARYSTFSLWLIRLGIKVSYSRPHHPQTNGKDERFHRTLKAELLRAHYFRDMAHIQHYFNEWRDVYNLERPHEGIGMQVPAERYKPSYREYPEQLPEVFYADDMLVKKVDGRGRVCVQGRQIFIGRPFCQEYVGLRSPAEEESIIEIFYSHQKLGEVNLKLTPKKTMINLYSGKITDL